MLLPTYFTSLNIQNCYSTCFSCWE
jgi:hypothetical protein